MNILESNAHALRVLRSGGVLIFPTETSYAMGCDATNDQAVAKVFAVKGRKEGKGTPVILPEKMNPEEVVEWSEHAAALAKAHWPGPLNIIAPRRRDSPISFLAGTEGTQSVRKSSHPVANALATALGLPIVATSANRSGEPSLFDSKDIRKVFATGNMPDAFLDVGDLPKEQPSTTVAVFGDTVRVVRQGRIIL